jgi:hypothetical protein
MKKVIASVALFALGFTLALQAQVVNDNTNGVPGAAVTSTSPPTSWTDIFANAGKLISGSTNWVVDTGLGHSVQGTGRSLVWGQVGYNFNQNVGLALGYDYLWGSGHTSFNQVSGGITLQMPIHPFAFIGSTFLTNVLVTPWAGQFMATASKGNVVSSITTAGINYDIVKIKNLTLSALAGYEKRAGSGYFDGGYGLVGVALRRNF